MCLRRAHGAAAQGGVVAGIGSELAKEGAKAAIAQFAPDLSKHVDPTSYALTQIREQLAALDTKLTELKNYQQQVEHHLNCVVRRTALNTILASANAHLQDLADIGTLPMHADRTSRLNTLSNDLLLLNSQQNELHLDVWGADGALRACAQHIESSQRPFLTSELAPAVHDFYAAYEAAAIALLTVRVNIVTYKGSAFAPGKADTMVREVEGWLGKERDLIKPAFPNTESYDTRTDTVFKTRVYGTYSGSNEVKALRAAGWYVTGETTIPTCSAIQSVVQATGLTGAAALNELRRRNVLNTTKDLRCYDDHDTLHLFDLERFHYTRVGYGNLLSGVEIVARRAAGFIDVSRFSYVLR
jgi:hypothetical protein